MNDYLIQELIKLSQEKLALKNHKLDPEFYYQSLPLCVIDSVFSIGVRYEAVKKTVMNFCKYKSIHPFRPVENKLPEIDDQYSIQDFISDFEGVSSQELANFVFKNKQRTSTRNGILKAEAVMLFLKELDREKINYFQDLQNITADFEDNIKKIPGQKSGISLQYFFMLAGQDDLIKPDRMVIRFIESVAKRKVASSECQGILSEVCQGLSSLNIKITPRELDNAIWNYQRSVVIEV